MSTGKSLSLREETLGPAMTALNPRQRAFVVAMFELGENATYADAARRAGYPDNGKSAIWVQGHALAHSEKVQAAFREEAERLAAGLLPLSHAVMVATIKDRSNPDRFKAVKHAQALAGVSPTQKHEVVHKNDTASLRAQLAAAIDLFKSVAPQAFGNDAPMIDVTPEDWVAT